MINVKFDDVARSKQALQVVKPAFDTDVQVILQEFIDALQAHINDSNMHVIEMGNEELEGLVDVMKWLNSNSDLTTGERLVFVAYTAKLNRYLLRNKK